MWTPSFEVVARFEATPPAALNVDVAVLANAVMVVGALWLSATVVARVLSRRRGSAGGARDQAPAPKRAPAPRAAPTAPVSPAPPVVEVEVEPAIAVAPDETPVRPEALMAGEPVEGDTPRTVLVVEDEEALRELTRRILTKRGFIVREAADAAAALELFHAIPSRPDLLLTDIVMPGSSGKELADQLCQLHPSLSVLFMSGFAGNVMQRYGVEGEFDEVLQKPFDAAQLSAAVQRALEPGV